MSCKNSKRNIENKILEIYLNEGNKKMVKNILVEFHHGSEEFNKPMRGIKDNGINKDVLGGLIIMKTVDVK
jgi:hypothetical protein